MRRMRTGCLALAVGLTLVAGCGGFRGRGQMLLRGRRPYDIDPSGVWSAESSLPWGTGHTLEVLGPGPVFHVVRRDGAGQPLAYGVGVVEAGHLFVGYSGSFENCQIAVYREGASLVEGVWAGGQSRDLGTEEWDAIGPEDPFAGAFGTYGTNPGSHAEYRQRVVVAEEAPGVYNVRWYSGTQVYVGTGLLVGDRFAVAAVLTFDESRSHAMWSQRGYALGTYDLTTGTGVAVFRDSPNGQPVVGSDQIGRL